MCRMQNLHPEKIIVRFSATRPVKMCSNGITSVHVNVPPVISSVHVASLMKYLNMNGKDSMFISLRLTKLHVREGIRTSSDSVDVGKLTLIKLTMFTLHIEQNAKNMHADSSLNVTLCI